MGDLFAAGIFLNLSRWSNVDSDPSKFFYDRIPDIVKGIDFNVGSAVEIWKFISTLYSFHDIGQAMVQIAYGISFFVVFAPSFVKHIPWIKREIRRGGVVGYVQCPYPLDAGVAPCG